MKNMVWAMPRDGQIEQRTKSHSVELILNEMLKSYCDILAPGITKLLTV